MELNIAYLVGVTTLCIYWLSFPLLSSHFLLSIHRIENLSQESNLDGDALNKNFAIFINI